MGPKYEYEVPGHSPWHAAQNVAQGPGILAEYLDELRGNKRYRVSIEEIVEEPQWWERTGGNPWDPSKGACEVVVYPTGSGWFVKVYGTTTDRDAKRDALVSAADKAGRP